MMLLESMVVFKFAFGMIAEQDWWAVTFGELCGSYASPAKF